MKDLARWPPESIRMMYLKTSKKKTQRIIALQNIHSANRYKQDIGKTFKVLVEKTSRRSAEDMCGRTDQNKMVVFPKENAAAGDYVFVKITDATSATLIGHMTEPVVAAVK